MSEFNDPTLPLASGESQNTIASEHQSPYEGKAKNDPNNDASSPSDEEQKIVRMVEKLYSEAKRARSTYDRRWLEFYKFFKGKQWKEKRPSYRHSEVLNFIFSEIQTILPILTDTRPNIETQPEEPQDYEFSQIMTHILRSKWDVHNWNYTVAEIILDGCIYGTGLSYVPWNPKKMQGLGDFDFKSFDPLYFFPDPNASDINSDDENNYCGYVVTAVPTFVGKLKADYPDKADLIKPDLADLYLAKTSREDLDEYRLKSPVDNRTMIEDGKAFMSARPNQALKITCYLQSDEMVMQKSVTKDDDGNDVELQEEIRKYPNGRKICIVSNRVISDDPLEYIDGKFPFARFIDHIIPREMWGVGEVEMLEGPQQILNKLCSYMLDVLILMGNPIWMIDTDSGIDADNLFNIPGAVIEKNPKTGAERLPGVELQPFVLEMFKYFQESVMDKLGSSRHVSQGASPFPGASGYAINQLQEAAQTKLRAKSRNLEICLKKSGDMMVNRILQFYTIPRIIRLTGDENAAKFFKFSVSEATDESGESKKVATIIPYELDETSGGFKEGPIKTYDIKSSLDVKITTGSTLPFARAQKSQISKDLYSQGIIDTEQYLRDIEYPNVENIIQKLQLRYQDAAQTGQAVQKLPPQPPPAVP